MYRITVCSFAPGSLALEVESNGSVARSRASVSTIKKFLANHGHSISADDLAAIAFCGQKRVFVPPATAGTQRSA